MMIAGVGTLQLHHHVRAAEEFAGGGFLDEAHRVIRPAVESEVSGVLAERAHILYLKLCRELFKDEDLAAGIEAFGKKYSGSSRAKEVCDIVKLEPGAIFQKKEIALPASAQKIFEEPDVITLNEHRLVGYFKEFFDIFNDPRLFLFFVVMLPLTIFAGWYSIFIFAFMITAVIRAFSRVEWGRLMLGSRVDEERERRDADASTLLNRAVC